MLGSASNKQTEVRAWEGGRADLMRRSWWLAALVLAVAGLVFIAAARGNGRKQESGLTELGAVFRDRRPIEPRLTGGFGYAPCQTGDRAGRLLPKVDCSGLPDPGSDSYDDFLRVLESAQKGGEDSLHEQGASQLITASTSSQTAAALKTLEEAVERSPKDAGLLNDLAVAYFEQAHRLDEPEDLVRALDTAVRAHEADPVLPEARFNLALALERLQLRQTATRAWKSYLEIDTDSGWANEARNRLHLLEDRKIAESSPQDTREHALEGVLGHWGDRVLAGEGESALQALRLATSLGRSLGSIGGDQSVSAAVKAIRNQQENPLKLHALARGHKEFQAAMAAYRALRTDEAAAHFSKARGAFVQGQSLLELWALCGLARCWGYEGKYEEARQAYEEILTEVDPQIYPSLTGWTEWGLGWIAARQGRYGEALSRTLSMRDSYEKAQESEHLGFARFLLGQSLVLLGQKRTAWQDLYQALESLSATPMSFRRHVLLLGASSDAFEDRLPHAGLLFREECLWAAEESGDPIRRAESRWAMAEVLAALGQPRKALEELRTATNIVRSAPGDPPVRKLRADLLLIEGEVRAQADPQKALSILTESIDEYRMLNATLSVAYTSLSKARVERDLGLTEQAHEDLATALRILEDPDSRIGEEDLRLSYSETVQDVYDEMILSQWVDQRRPREALETIERARAFQAQSRLKLPLALSRLPGDRVVIEYALLRDRLLTWTIYQGRISVVEHPYGILQIEALVERFIEALRREDEGESIRLSSKLYGILIPPWIDRLPLGQRISFVPDRILNKVPFAGLRNPQTGKFLVESHVVTVAPNLARLIEAVRHPAQPITSALLIGNPSVDRRVFPRLESLSAAEDELAGARTVFPRTLSLLREEATKPKVLEEMDQFEALIFAGHAVSNSNLPSRSYMVLAPSGPADPGLLLAGEIGKNRFRRLRLVVLSACDSAGPRATRNAGIAGLAKPFLDGGAHAVVGTLWSVEDRKTAAVLRDLYPALAEGQPPAQALQQAQLKALKKSGRLGAWSALVVVSADSF